MKRLLPLLVGFLLLLPSGLSAQAGSWPHPCGTPAGKSDWLKNYQRNPEAFRRGNDTTLYVPLTIHILGNDDGEGYYRVSRLKEAFCQLNESFSDANIQFFIAGDLNYLDNSEWYSHETVLEGAAMMFENNVAGTLNIYFVSDPAGNCGYNLPYAGIAMRKSCSGPNDNTWAHEIGHALSIPHPFLGWEGGVSHDGSVNHDFGLPAPAQVTYDYTFFQDTLIQDTTIIDTAIVELVDGSNCQVAADGFCDTSPDYIAQRWFCNADGESPTMQTDPNGASFRSDGTLIMGYSDDACQARFTQEQIAAMRADLFNEHSDLISETPPLPPLASGVTTLLTPEEGAVTPYDEVLISWAPVEHATAYILQVSPFPTFGFREEFIVTAPQFMVTDLVAERDYYWRVTAYNAYRFCAPMSEAGTFTTSAVSSSHSPGELESVRLYPQPALQGVHMAVTVYITAAAATSGQLQLLNTVGKLVHQRHVALSPGQQALQLPVAGLPAGLYVMRFRNKEGFIAKKILIQ